MGLSQGDFIRSEKEELKENYTTETSCVQFFRRKKIISAGYRIFCLQRIRIFPMHIFYIDFRKCTLRIFIPLELYDHMRIFQRYQKQKFSRCHGFSITRTV